MRHAVLEPVQEALLPELRGLEVDLVLKRCIVSKGYLLVRLFLTHADLFLERIERAHRERHIRQGKGVRTVPGVLAMQGVDGKVDLTVFQWKN